MQGLFVHLRGAGDGSRTRNIQLGRLALYQLSYSRPLIDQFTYRGAANLPR
jgi:hypothetical protein